MLLRNVWNIFNILTWLLIGEQIKDVGGNNCVCSATIPKVSGNCFWDMLGTSSNTLTWLFMKEQKRMVVGGNSCVVPSSSKSQVPACFQDMSGTSSTALTVEATWLLIGQQRKDGCGMQHCNSCGTIPPLKPCPLQTNSSHYINSGIWDFSVVTHQTCVTLNWAHARVYTSDQRRSQHLSSSFYVFATPGRPNQCQREWTQYSEKWVWKI